MKSVFEKLAGPFKEFGFFAGLLYGIDRILVQSHSGFRLYNYELMVQPITDKPLIPQNLSKSIEIREIERGDPVLVWMPVPPEILKSRFEQPTVCLGAFQKGKIIAYLWLCFGPYQEDEVRCTFVPLPETEAVFDFDLYVAPESRLGIGFLGIWDGASKYLRARGIRFSFSRVSRYNLASRRAHKHFGWKRVGRALYLKARWCQIMVATIAPYLHLSFSQSGSPLIRLRPGALLQELPGSNA